MSKVLRSAGSMEDRSFSRPRPLVSRGLRRAQEKRQRKRQRVPADALILGLDLARENQAASYGHGSDIFGRRRFRAGAETIDQLFPEARALAEAHGFARVIVAFEPAGHYWCLAAEACERAGLDYVLVHTLAVKKEREITRFNPEHTDPRDADLICSLPHQGKFTECRLPRTRERDALWQLARDYMRVRKLAAAERTRLHNFWHRTLPEFFTVFRDPAGATALATACALAPFSQLATLSTRSWVARVRRAAHGQRILTARAARLLPLLQAAHADPVRRSGEGMPARIRHTAQRRRLLEQQKADLRDDLLHRYQSCDEAPFLDSISGSDPFYNALTLALVGDFLDYDDPRALVKLAGSEVNHYASGDWQGSSRMSHRGRSPLRAAAYQQARHLVAHNDDFRARFFYLLHDTERARLTKQQAYVALMNRYLRTAHVLVTRQQFYRSPAHRGEGGA